MAAISVQVQGLSKKMKQVKALNGLNMKFQANTLHGILGPEGAGKTTLLRHLIGLLRPDVGSIHYFREDQEVDYQVARPLMAYMPQTQSLYAELSIHEHLEFFRTLYRLTDEEYHHRRERLLQVARLEEFTDRLASQLSGGMYKKLGLICALLSAPKLMLLDEPTNGVDPLSRRDFWQLLHDLKSEEITIVVSTSYMDEALKCEQVHLIFDGHCLREGEPRELLREQKCKNFEEIFLLYDRSLEKEGS